MQSRINNRKTMGQLIDFGGLCVDDYIYPTDIDGLIEYRNTEYILFEVKYVNSEVPYAQRLALQRMVDDFTAVGKSALAIICEHTVHDATVPVVAATCKVREMYNGKEKRWFKPNCRLLVKDAVNKFHKSVHAAQSSGVGGVER